MRLGIRPQRALFLVAVLGAATAPDAVAQATAGGTVAYRLERESAHEEGCFPPCMCPVLRIGDVRGTFRLTPAGSDGLFAHYQVTDVNWRVPRQTPELRITGSGTYKIGGEFALQQQLTLDLRVGDGPVQRFDSGLRVGGADFPRIDLRISLRGEYCYDTVFEVHARPARRLAIDRSGLSWEVDPRDPGYDVVTGDLQVLRQSRGDFATATTDCLASRLGASWLAHAATPAAGGASWYLLRPSAGSEASTYDSRGAGQPSSRDPGIDASPASCP